MKTERYDRYRLQEIRFSSLLFALRLIGAADNPVSEGIKLANELLEELQQNE